MEPASDSSFWGLVMVEGKEYKQVPKFNFRLSMAALDLETAKGPISLKVKINGSDFILCNLSKESPQSHLDLIFGEGEPIKFYTTGSGSVHLTGYSLPEDSLGDEFDEEFSDDESMDSEIEKLNLLAANNKRKNTESLKLTGKDAKKLKTEVKPEPAKVQKVIDVDPKQLLQKKDNKAPDVQQKGKQQANQPQPKKDNKPPTDNKPAKKELEESDDEDDDDDLSIDEDDSVDMNKIQAMMDDDDSEVDDEDLESDDDESDDEADIAKLKQIKSGLNKSNQGAQSKPAGKPQNTGSPAGGFQKKPQQQQNKPQHQQQFQQNKPKQQNGHPNKFGNQNKTPQQNRGQTPANKSHQKHQQTPFHKGQQNSNKKQQGSPFQHQNKSFGGSNKKPFKKAGAF